MGVGCQRNLDEGASLAQDRPKASLRVQPFTNVTTFTRIQPSETYTNSTSKEFDFSSNFSDSIFYCSFDGSPSEPCHPPITFRRLPEGVHQFAVYSNSPTGGLDGVGVSHNWTVDTTPPTTQVSGTQTALNAMVFEVSANEPAIFDCTIDGVVLNPCVSPMNLTGLSKGHHIFHAFAIDRAGNADPVGSTYEFDLGSRDNLTTQLTYANPNRAFTNQTSIQFGFTSNDSQATFLCRLSGQSSTRCSTDHVISGLPDGDYTFQVQARDTFGYVDPVGASHTWTVDTVPPLSSGLAIRSTSTSLTISWTTNEPSSTSLYWGRDADASRVVADDGIPKTNHQVRLTGLSSNTNYTVIPAGVDRAGNGFTGERASGRTMR